MFLLIHNILAQFNVCRSDNNELKYNNRWLFTFFPYFLVLFCIIICFSETNIAKQYYWKVNYIIFQLHCTRIWRLSECFWAR